MEEISHFTVATKDKDKDVGRVVFLTYKGDDEGKKNIWYFDNGASNHMCGYKDLFVKLDEAVNGDVSFGDLSKILIKCKVTIIILSKNGDKKYMSDV